MSEDRLFFRMNTLLGYTDIDAFTAQKNMGSRTKYFETLDSFIDIAPEMAQKLEQLVTEGEQQDYYDFVGQLQDVLMQIGASAMVWEAERAAALSRDGERKKCVDESFVLATKVRALRDKIREAKVGRPDGTEIRHSEVPPAIPAVKVGQQDRPQAALRPEPFEKLMLLIENFELDDAVNMLRSLLEYSYSREIDAVLTVVYNKLTAYDYETATAHLQRALKMVETAEDSERKNGKKKILAVDDVPDVLNTVKSVLSKQYMVYGVTNHMAALKFLAANHADLILLDIEMPDLDGFAMLSIIRRIKAYEATPVLFLTGSVSVENIRKSHTMGANDFIKKPIEAAVLISRIEKHLEEAGVV